jgi:Flp pilus assembly protein TadG
MQARLLSFLSDRSGTTGMLFASLLIPMLGFIGLAIDFGRAHHASTRLRAIVDSAAIAGARLPATANQNRVNAVLAQFEANTKDTMFEGMTPQIEATNAGVTVTAQYTSDTTLLALMGLEEIDVEASTTARSQVENGGVACMLALNPTTSDGLHLQGVNKFSSQNCWTWVNSTSYSSINAVGTAMGQAQGFCTAGKVIGAEHFAPAPWPGCEPMDDPFARKFETFAPNTTCTQTNLRVNKETVSLSPGVYCGGIELRPGADVTFKPGLYVIKGGKFDVHAQSVASGQGVTFYFTGSGTQLLVQGGANLTLKAPATGDTAGFVFVQDKWSNPGAEAEIQGGGSVNIEGVVYTPTWRLAIGGNGDINENSKFFTMVADSFYMEGNGKLYVKSDATAAGLPNLMPKIPTGPLLLQ